MIKISKSIKKIKLQISLDYLRCNKNNVAALAAKTTSSAVISHI